MSTLASGEQLRARAHGLFLELLDLPPSERAGRLDDRCVGAEAEPLRAEVEALLAADAAADGFLEPPALEAGGGGNLSGRWLEGRRIGQYAVQRRVGIGGMCTVYEAVQSRPRRRVALKLLRVGLGTRESRQRFEQEAEILGRLRHPGIAEIYEAGTHDSELGPIPFFALEFVVGARSLTQWAEHAAADLRTRVELLAQVCDAVEHAHQHGVVHRDLKPSNVLVGDDGRPRLIDFGVARALDDGLRAATLGTQAGELVGTLGYMSPEQCAAEGDIDARSDVYALGVVLYELVAGELPYPTARVPAALIAELVRTHEPRAPTAALATRWRELDAIVLTALEKSPARRYPSAAAMAEDLRRALRGEPVHAARSRRSYPLRKLAWRARRALPAAALLGCAGFAGAAMLPSAASPDPPAVLETPSHAPAAPVHAVGYLHRIAIAERALLAGDLARAKAALAECEPAQRRWEWHRMLAAVDHSAFVLPLGAPVIALALDRHGGSIALTDDGRVHALVRSDDGAVPRWTVSRSLALDPDPTALALAGDTVLVAGDHARVQAWRYRDPAAELTSFAAEGSAIWGLAVTPRGDELAVSRRDGTLEIWDPIHASRLRSFAVGDRLGPVAVTDTEVLAAIGTHGATVRSLADGDELRRLATDDGIEAMLVDGEHIYTAGWHSRILVFGRDAEQPLRELPRVADGILDLAKLDAHTLVSAGRDGEIVLWDLERGAAHRTLRGHDLGVEAVVVGGDGRWLSSASLDGTVRSWDLEAFASELALAPAGEKIHSLAWADHGDVLIGGTGVQWGRSDEHRVVAWSTRDGRELAAATDHGATVDVVAVSPDGRTVVTADRDGVLVIRDRERLAARVRVDAHVGRIAALAFDPGGARIASAGEDGSIAIWRSDDGRLLARTSELGALADLVWADRLIAVGEHGIVRWSGNDDAPRSLDTELVDPRALAVLPGGELLIGTANGELARVEPEHGALRWRAPTFGRAVIDIALDPAGDRIAVASQDYRIRLHDVATGELVLTAGQHDSAATTVAFAPDGSALASGGFDRLARIWRAPTARRRRAP